MSRAGVRMSFAAGLFLFGLQRPLPDDALLQRLLTLPRAVGHSEIRADYVEARHETRVWINTNEDDSRLWNRRGAQMDAEFRVSAVTPGRVGTSFPDVVSIEFASLGELLPGNAPHGLMLFADGRAVVLRAQAEPEARSGQLLFLTLQSNMPLAEFLKLVTASRVEGRIWGHEFALQRSQLELLRAYAARLIG